MGGLCDQGLSLAAVGDLDLVGRALLAGDDAGVAVESGMEAPVGDARVDLEVDALALLEASDRALWRGGTALARVVRELLTCAVEGSV